MSLWVIKHDKELSYWNGQNRWFTPSLDFAMKYHSSEAAAHAATKGGVKPFGSPKVVTWDDVELAWRLATEEEEQAQVILETHRTKLGKNTFVL